MAVNRAPGWGSGRGDFFPGRGPGTSGCLKQGAVHEKLYKKSVLVAVTFMRIFNIVLLLYLNPDA
jgi:hypothetical protein